MALCNFEGSSLSGCEDIALQKSLFTQIHFRLTKGTPLSRARTWNSVQIELQKAGKFISMHQ